MLEKSHLLPPCGDACSRRNKRFLRGLIAFAACPPRPGPAGSRPGLGLDGLPSHACPRAPRAGKSDVRGAGASQERNRLRFFGAKALLLFPVPSRVPRPTSRPTCPWDRGACSWAELGFAPRARPSLCRALPVPTAALPGVLPQRQREAGHGHLPRSLSGGGEGDQAGCGGLGRLGTGPALRQGSQRAQPFCNGLTALT